MYDTKEKEIIKLVVANLNKLTIRKIEQIELGEAFFI